MKIKLTLTLTLALTLLCKILVSQDLIDSTIMVAHFHLDYGVNDYVLTENQESQLDSFCKNINLAVGQFELNGYADNQGSDQYNFELSQKRNAEVRNFLANQNIIPERIIINSHGEKNIAHNESSEEVRQQNIRVTINITQPQQFKVFRGYLTSEDSLTRTKGEVSLYVGKNKKTFSTDASGNFTLKVPMRIATELYFSSKGHFHKRKVITISKVAKTDHVLVSLRRMDFGTMIQTNLEFVRGKSILLEASQSELDAIFDLMTVNDELCIEIRGHVYARKSISLDSSSVKFGLSIARSLELYNYLNNRGIAEERMVANGYGNSQLLHPNAQIKKEMSANRRVEIKKLKCDYISKLNNPTLDNLESYRVIEDFPLGRQYNMSTIDDDLATEDRTVVKHIKNYAAKMIKDKLDPKNFTYLQIFSMYRDEKFQK